MRCILLILLLLVGAFSQAHAQARRLHHGRGGRQPKDAAQHAPAPVKPVLLCSIATGSCYGKCPQFKAEFFRPGRMLYQGRKNAKPGRHAYVLPDNLIKNLLLEARKAKLTALPTPPAAPPDVPVDTLYILVDGKARTLIFTTVNAPKPLFDFNKNLRENIDTILLEQEPDTSGGR